MSVRDGLAVRICIRLSGVHIRPSIYYPALVHHWFILFCLSPISHVPPTPPEASDHHRTQAFATLTSLQNSKCVESSPTVTTSKRRSVL